MLFPLSTIYRAVTWSRLRAFESGLLSSSKLPVPVISVGNITTGGTGKTPLVEWICRNLARDGSRVCVLTRGYGRVSPRTQVVVSNGTEILADERQAGDEPLLLAEKLLGMAAVICNPNRVAAGQWAIKNLGTQVFVLDDGFQHLRLKRDLDIVSIDATEPWGGGRLLPQGRLREPQKNLARAHCVVITRADQTEDPDSIAKTIHEFAGDIPIFMSRMVPSGTFTLDGTPVASPLQQVGAFCGVGNAESFFRQLRNAGYHLALTRAFADHHHYKQTEIDALIREARVGGVTTLMTTAKDAVKLRNLSFSIPCHVLEIETSIEEEDRLLELLRSAIAAA